MINKYFKKYYKYLIPACFIVIGFFAVHTPAHAGSFSYKCESGELVTTTYSISKALFKENTPENFTAEGQVRSYCSDRFINLKAQNKNKLTDPKSTIFQNVVIYAGSRYPAVPQGVTFTSPILKGPYSVRFLIGVDEPADVLACNVSNSGSFNKLSTANTFPPTVYDLGENTSYPLNVRLYYNTYETPNEFSIYKYPTNEFVLTSNWKGVANYAGPWGSVLTGGYYLNTAKQGYIDFTATQRYYKVVVKTVTGTVNSDTWDHYISCS